MKEFIYIYLHLFTFIYSYELFSLFFNCAIIVDKNIVNNNYIIDNNSVPIIRIVFKFRIIDYFSLCYRFLKLYML